MDAQRQLVCNRCSKQFQSQLAADTRLNKRDESIQLKDAQDALLKNAEKLTRSQIELNAISNELFFQEQHDNLTGLFNRRYFNLQLEALLQETSESQQENTLLYIDLDQFQVINEGCGHAAGDELLQQIAKLLTNNVRNIDFCARLGDDEFGLVLRHCTMNEALKIAESLREKINQHGFQWHDVGYTVSVSIGLVPLIDTDDGLDAVMRNASIACHIAKEQGKNRTYQFYEQSEDAEYHHEVIASVAKINQALTDNRFELYFQSIAPLKSDIDQGEHYEILIRMHDEENQLVPPNRFLPAAERYHLISRIDCWVLHETCRLLTEYPQSLSHLDVCAINLSGQSLTDKYFIDFAIDCIEQSGIPPEKICFEITETNVIKNMSMAIKFIHMMRERGIKFSLDDFGSGLSSFAYLKQLPVDFLKIDGLFVREISKNPVDLAMVKSINDIGHVMGKRTIAEFVEDESAIESLKRLGVDYAQGYGISLPQPFKPFLKQPRH